MVSFGRLRPLPKTARGKAHVFLVMDLFSRHAEAYAITKEKRRRKVALRGWSAIVFRSGDAPTPFHPTVAAEFVSEVCRGTVRMLGSVKKCTSSYTLPRYERHSRETEPHPLSNVVVPYREG